MQSRRLKILGINIKAERLKKSYSQEELAELAGISVGTMSLIETGKQHTGALNLIDISKALEIDINILLKDV